MIVISDATPINVLVRIGLADVLLPLYHRVIIPSAVRAELSHPNTPEIVREWIETPPAWLDVQAPRTTGPLDQKGRGEREAVALARELNADLVLVDDRVGARAVRALGIPTIGTVGILELGSSRGLCPLKDSIERLRSTGFFVTEEIISAALTRDEQRRKT